MSIRPIDIQTLLAQMSQVGKEQAAEKEGAALQASIQNAALQKRREESKEAVQGAEDAQNTTRPVNERQAKSQEWGKKGEAGGEAEPDAPSSEAVKTDIVRDPDLGTHIDLSG